jgi:hypothetical protein
VFCLLCNRLQVVCQASAASLSGQGSLLLVFVELHQLTGFCHNVHQHPSLISCQLTIILFANCSKFSAAAAAAVVATRHV